MEEENRMSATVAPPASPFQGWNGSAASARALQVSLAGQVRIVDDYPPLRVIAGVDVGFEEGGAVTRAAAVLLDADTLLPLAQAVARVPTRMPYVPGLLSFRELPALLEVLKSLPQVPDLIFCDGQGIAHPRRLGIASHLGVVTGLPTIGVAKNILCGEHDELPAQRGARVPLMHRAETIGWVLRSKDGVRPLIVSPGHRVSMQSAVDLVLGYGRGYRLPEPTRLADRLASRRGPMPGPESRTMELF
jgi:deoxyribonuclease V